MHLLAVSFIGVIYSVANSLSRVPLRLNLKKVPCCSGSYFCLLRNCQRTFAHLLDFLTGRIGKITLRLDSFRQNLEESFKVSTARGIQTASIERNFVSCDSS
jgi:hypothetical protein